MISEHESKKSRGRKARMSRKKKKKKNMRGTPRGGGGVERAKPTQLGFGLSGRKKKEKNCGDDAASPLPRSPPFLLLGIQIDLHDAHLVISSNSLDHALAAKRRRLHAQQRRLVGEFRVEARQFDGRTAPGVDGDGRGRVGDRDGGGARTEEREEHREGGEEHRRAGHRFVGSWKGGGGGGERRDGERRREE